MDNAVALNSPTPLAEAPNFGARLAALPARSKLMMGAGLAGLAAVVLAMTLWSSQGDYKLLYSGLSDKDGGAVIAQLAQMNIPYRYTEGGGAILVPASKVHDLRFKLATLGLPKGTGGGFELMDGQKFGITQFQERLTFQRGLEGELVRSITSVSSVQGARVHLALPNQNGLFREQPKPSASVMLTLHPGRSLDASQIAGIVHLVASSVPELNPKAVSVLDQTGALISQPPEGSNAPGLDAQQLQYKSQVESGYSKRIFELLEPVVGRENLRANVTADLDFSQTEATSEEFKPNQGQNATPSVRSQQTSEQVGAGAAPATGIPGAASNQPPQAAVAPLTGASAPLTTALNGGPGATSRRDNVVNFEVDKTVRVTRGATGTVKRLNAAVVVNSRTVTDAKGKTSTVPLTPEELEKLTSLVQESIGFSKDRGDSVKVVNAPFQIEKPDLKDVPLWKQPEVLDLLRTFAVPAALVAVAAMVFFGMVRPGLKAALAPPPPPPTPEPGSTLDAVVADDETLPALQGASTLALEGPSVDENLERIRTLAKANPAAVASILSGWVSGEAA